MNQGQVVELYLGCSFLVLCIGKRKVLCVHSCAVGFYGSSFSLMRLFGVTQYGLTHPTPPRSYFYLERVIIV